MYYTPTVTLLIGERDPIGIETSTSLCKNRCDIIETLQIQGNTSGKATPMDLFVMTMRKKRRYPSTGNSVFSSCPAWLSLEMMVGATAFASPTEQS
jgi:hypothetical protein